MMTAWRASVVRLVEAPAFGHVIIALILLNAAILGAEALPGIAAKHGAVLASLDTVLLTIFVMELGLRLFANGPRFFRDPWSLFDLAVVAVALAPSSGAFSVLRAMRVLRVLRLVSAIPQLRRVVEGLLTAIPGLGAIVGVMLIVLYVFAVMATKLYGTDYPEWFGSLTASLFTLFQIMTLEGWADIARQMMTTHPSAWLFFLVYILLSTFTVLNFFIAVIVDSMQKVHLKEEKEEKEEKEMLISIRQDILTLHTQVSRLLDRG